jgi:dihydroorotase
MPQAFDLLLRGGTCVNHNGIGGADVGIKDGRIAGLGDLAQSAADKTIDVTGLHILPGVIDTQVHLREPGLEYKEDLHTGARAAVKGGVTAVFEMPNTKPATTTEAAITDKLARAKGRMACDYAFYVGASPENVDMLDDLESLPGTAGVKMFMGSSTGTLLIPDDETVLRVLRNGRRRVAVHAEDEARLEARKTLRVTGDPASHPVWRDAETALLATQRLIGLARQAGRRVHVLHVTTADEIRFLRDHRDIATVETTPQHLTLAAPDCYRRLGTLAQMNPPIRDETHRAGLWAGVTGGIVDMIGSDHAPHTLDEKAKTYPDTPSGMTGVQTLVPILLDHVAAGRLTLSRFVDLTSAGPARAFSIAGKGRLALGFDADLTLVDLKARHLIENRWIESRCGWTPFDGVTVTGWPKATLVRGRIAMWEDEILGEPAGAPIRFQETLG